jgi:hypothetical protein
LEPAFALGFKTGPGEFHPKALIREVAENRKEKSKGGIFLHVHRFVSLPQNRAERSPIVMRKRWGTERYGWQRILQRNKNKGDSAQLGMHVSLMSTMNSTRHVTRYESRRPFFEGGRQKSWQARC